MRSCFDDLLISVVRSRNRSEYQKRINFKSAKRCLSCVPREWITLTTASLNQRGNCVVDKPHGLSDDDDSMFVAIANWNLVSVSVHTAYGSLRIQVTEKAQDTDSDAYLCRRSASQWSRKLGEFIR